ncbi:fungal-specific transcription factor domain-containing protein [Geopyxis carbonaria]|nr:fungal-specific transcription factor domain-containing protein [Geopyxis carbonaria]
MKKSPPNIGTEEGPSDAPITRKSSIRKRPYQTRRKERSCDACKLRKTKCDANGEEACSACVTSGIQCRFSSTEHEGRKVGPAKRIRDLERTVEELTQKLREIDGQQAIVGSIAPRIIGPNAPSISGSESAGYSDSNITGAASSHESLGTRSGPLSQHTDSMNTMYGRGPRQYSRPKIEPMTWNPNAFGPGSAPQFIESYKEYLERLGFHTQDVNIQSGNIFQAGPMVPLLSDYNPSPASGVFSMDLRAFLPTRESAEMILEVFRRTIQSYKAMFYWPILEEKFERAWSSDMLENDTETVGRIFCVVMMVLAVGSQIIDVDEVVREGRGTGYQEFTQERNGWKFFELARKYLGLNNPIYTLEDATGRTLTIPSQVFLMSLYLDKATLPSPCWMISGAMARVCQDIGLHRRRPQGGNITNVQLESRTRLFWMAYVQDKRVSMKMGRPFILREDDCDVPYPGSIETSGISRDPRFITPQESGGRVRHLEDSNDSIDHDEVSRTALQTCEVIINACKVSEQILTFKLGGSIDGDMLRLRDLDDRLQQCWSTLPIQLRNYDSNEVLDLPSVRALFIVQHARLILFRYFMEFSPELPITPEFRSFCLNESVRISKITARILYRAQLSRDFTKNFGVRTDDLVHLHTFRVAIILLLGLYSGSSESEIVTHEDVNICLVSLQAIARVHITGKRYLHLYKEFASFFDHPSAEVTIPDQTTENINPEYERNPEIPRASSEWANTSVSWSNPIYQTQTASDLAMQAPYPVSLPQEMNGADSFGANVNAPNIMSRVGTGDWSSFQDMLHWDPEFGHYVTGDNTWNFQT